jgi:hypothetical protein
MPLSGDHRIHTARHWPRRIRGRHSFSSGSADSQHALGAATEKDNPEHQVNMFWNGLFHCVTWILTFVGVVNAVARRRIALPRGRGKDLRARLFWAGDYLIP